MPADTGTPSEWLDDPSHRVVTVHCVCAPEVAASRFPERQRHPGHLDRESSPANVLSGLQQLAQLPPLNLGRRIDVDTAVEPDLAEIAGAIRDALTRLG